MGLLKPYLRFNGSILQVYTTGDRDNAYKSIGQSRELGEAPWYILKEKSSHSEYLIPLRKRKQQLDKNIKNPLPCPKNRIESGSMIFSDEKMDHSKFWD